MELKTKKGESFFIDDEDYERVKNITWCLNGRRYVNGRCKVTQRTVNIHRVILDAPLNMQVDHIDRDPTNNRRENLRLCTKSENQKNKNSRGGSKYLGVCFHVRKGRATAIIASIRIGVCGKSVYLGVFPTEEAAARKYDEMAKIHHGEFANLNFKDEE